MYFVKIYIFFWKNQGNDQSMERMINLLVLKNNE